jgi:hypothetical protein
LSSTDGRRIAGVRYHRLRVHRHRRRVGYARRFGEDIEQIVVSLPKGDSLLDVNVFGKVMKLFRNGAEDSTAAMAVGLEARLKS